MDCRQSIIGVFLGASMKADRSASWARLGGFLRARGIIWSWSSRRRAD
jgi:hypothetical protein